MEAPQQVNMVVHMADGLSLTPEIRMLERERRFLLQVVLWLLYSAMMLTIPVPSHSAPSTWIHKYNFKTLRRFALIWLYVTKPLQSGLQFIFLLEGNSSWLDSTESSQGTLGWVILSHTKEKNRNMWSSESFRKPLSPQKLALLNTTFPFLASFGTASHYVVQPGLCLCSPLASECQDSFPCPATSCPL